MLGLAVVVDRDRAAAHVDILAHVAVADIREMRQFRALADVRILDFDEVVDLDAFKEVRVRTQVDELAELDIVIDLHSCA